MSSSRASAAPWLRAVLVTAVLASGCGSDSPTSPPNNQPTAVGGNVNKAPVVGASVTIRPMQASGAIGAAFAGPYTTDAAGNWSGEISATQSVATLVLVSNGGSYVDESSGSNVTIGGRDFYGFVRGPSSHVTPLTHATVLAAQALIESGATLADAVTLASTSSQGAFGFDFATTLPLATAGATTAQKTYAGLLGGISKLIDNNPALSAFPTASKAELVLAIAKDIPDGELDGRDAAGNSIIVPLGPPVSALSPSGGPFTTLPALSPTDLSAWLIATNTYCASVPELTGIAVDADIIWRPGIPTGPCQITFSGAGAAQLANTCFIPTSSDILTEDQFMWFDATDDVQILAIPTTAGASTIRTVYVTRPLTGLVVWSQSGTDPIPGITRAGGKVTFTNIVLPQMTGGGDPLTLNGELTEPVPGPQRAPVSRIASGP